ncbi:MAG: nucleotidyltransferase [Eubacterium sp.]|nr:nucleotidyltransferase [Eubacterium sp.]MCH4046894.1 nucleotidyltransferase [Eubacterium sp.]MCH4079991.1 nucleotidyltransferase [Eubacterium sp.]MCH4109967.1 nucleotidyltransferase [Eubacterium sp.]MCI1307537.1 nucleotidyltransferase [Eubacterium sp.]
MNKPTLLIMAAGMGSRYGGLKQIDPITDQGEVIMDFSLYDAMMAGFERAVFVIKKENEEAFRKLIDGRIDKYMDVEIVYQEMDDLPDGYKVPEGRVKPWGTGHAILAARHVIDGPFAVVNADDYYGPTAFHLLYDYLENVKDSEPYQYAMVGFQLEKTLSESGTVARGICELTDDNLLKNVTERTKVMSRGEFTGYTEDDGKTWTEIPQGSTVSMNFWGFTGAFMKEAWDRFPGFLDQILRDNPMKGEYFLPSIVEGQIKEGRAQVHVLKTPDKWYGVTYHEDHDIVAAAIQSMKDKGEYPVVLFRKEPENVVWRELRPKEE